MGKYIDIGGTTCVTSCGASEFLDGIYCLTSCPVGKYGDVALQSCVTSCSSDKYLENS